jgi:hypothetical protein
MPLGGGCLSKCLTILISGDSTIEQAGSKLSVTDESGPGSEHVLWASPPQPVKNHVGLAAGLPYVRMEGEASDQTRDSEHDATPPVSGHGPSQNPRLQRL